MMRRFLGSWRLPMTLCCLSLSLAMLYLWSRNALGQIPPGGGTPTVQFAYVEYYIAEDAGSVTIRVTLSAASSQTVTVNYGTEDGTATAPQYYTTASGLLTFNPGDTNATFQVSINNLGFSDYYTVNLTIGNPTNATLGTPNTATLVIIPPNTICPPTGSDS